MKILLMSDLHLEFEGALQFADEPGIGDGADVIVLAGDIHIDSRGVEWARAKFPTKKIVYVAGNHEFYGCEIVSTRAEIAAVSQRLDVTFLDDSQAVIDGVRFVGGTLWTDFALFGEKMVDECMKQAARSQNDYIRIRNGGLLLEPAETLDMHLITSQFLSKVLAEPFAGKTVLVTHMTPNIGSVEKYCHHDANRACYASNMPQILGKPDLWLHGHIHLSIDHVHGNTRVVCNPRGYPHGESFFDKLLGIPPGHQNLDFDPFKLIEI